MPDKVVIRLINTQSLDQSEEPKPKEVIVYHWNRIFGALFIALALGAGLIWGGRYLLKRSGDTQDAAVEQALKPEDKVSITGADIPMPEAIKLEERPNNPEVSPMGAIKPSAKALASAGKTGEKMPSEAQGKGVAAPSQREESGRVAETATKPVISILSRSVKRAQLTSNVIEDEPVDNLGPTIPMNAKGLIRVYLLMETSGLTGKTLFHDWYWRGKRMAHARIPIKRNTQTAASSKFIDRIMMGPWEVKIVDERENVLVNAAFEVR